MTTQLDQDAEAARRLHDLADELDALAATREKHGGGGNASWVRAMRVCRSAHEQGAFSGPRFASLRPYLEGSNESESLWREWLNAVAWLRQTGRALPVKPVSRTLPGSGQDANSVGFMADARTFAAILRTATDRTHHSNEPGNDLLKSRGLTGLRAALLTFGQARATLEKIVQHLQRESDARGADPASWGPTPAYIKMEGDILIGWANNLRESSSRIIELVRAGDAAKLDAAFSPGSRASSLSLACFARHAWEEADIVAGLFHVPEAAAGLVPRVTAMVHRCAAAREWFDKIDEILQTPMDKPGVTTRHVFLSGSEVEAKFGIKADTLRKQHSRGQLKNSEMRGKRWFYRLDDVEHANPGSFADV